MLDVNVLVSGFTATTGAPAKLIELWLRRRFMLVLSEHVLTTLARVWDRPYWRGRFQAHEARRALRLMSSRATFVVPVETIRGVAKDEEDDLVIATAVSGDVDFLVTGDRFLQELGTYEGVTILSPRQFLDLLEAETP